MKKASTALLAGGGFVAGLTVGLVVPREQPRAVERIVFGGNTNYWIEVVDVEERSLYRRCDARSCDEWDVR